METTIEAGEVGYIPLNVAIEVPKGYWVMLAVRSSTHKKGIMAGNGIGVGDSDFCGDDDEYSLIAHNFSDKTGCN